MRFRELKIDLGERERKAAATARRFPVSISSEAAVVRRLYGETWEEVLSHAPGAVDLSRGNLPVIEGHDRTRVNIGIVTGLRLDGPRLRGELVLGTSQRAGELSADIAAGIVSGISVGYTIDAELHDEKARRVTATRWTPYEVSIVSIPADVSVGINRSATMEFDDDPTTPTTTPPDAATRATIEAATRAERERATGIRELVRRASDSMPSAGIGDELAEELVQGGRSLDEARAAVFDRLATESDRIRTVQHVRVGEENSHAFGQYGGRNDGADFQRAAIDALLLRAGVPVAKPHAAAQDVSGSIFDIARLSLSRAGRAGSSWFGGNMGGSALLKRALSTSDFPEILGGALHAAVRVGYEAEPSSHRAWVHVVPVADFREQKRPILGSAPDLKQVNEGGEYTLGALDEDSTSYRIFKFGRLVALTWETLVSDNLAAFVRMQPALGQVARRKEADLVYSLFGENNGAGPTMQDKTHLFHAKHANLAATAPFSAEALAEGRTLMRKQTAVGGGYLALAPRFLIVPPEVETAAEIILANASRPLSTERTTPTWISRLELVVEPRLPANATYLAAGHDQIDTVELGLLEENMGGPMIEQEQGFVVDDQRWKVRHTAGAKVLDWRGLVKLPIKD